MICLCFCGREYKERGVLVMALKALNCPNCGGTYNPAKYRCEYCGSYIIISNENYVDLSKVKFDTKTKIDNKYPGIYVFGRLLGKGEKPITLGAANYFTGIVSAGGKLLLTNKSISFSAHGINVGRQETKIELGEITDVRVVANLLISQHIIVTTNKASHRFVVYHGKEWVEKIKYAIDHIEEWCDVDEPTPMDADYTVELRKLKNLLDEGIITQEEFNIKKRTILGI
jgi:DNA-directed RNA polymerase subunit RPC12/RpoP